MRRLRDLRVAGLIGALLTAAAGPVGASPSVAGSLRGVPSPAAAAGLARRELGGEHWQQAFYFRCAPDHFEFFVLASGPHASIFLPDRGATLARIESAAGLRYSDGHMQLSLQDDFASLDIGPDHHGNCRSDTERADAVSRHWGDGLPPAAQGNR
jgi:membrane-bound inhibitor of C-type lysozyme